jgi:hypothetical protein
MISGLAPGRAAETEMVGKSTCGRGDTGSSKNATAPERAMATVRRVVAMGRRINVSEIFIWLVGQSFGSAAGLPPGASFEKSRRKNDYSECEPIRQKIASLGCCRQGYVRDLPLARESAG